MNVESLSAINGMRTLIKVRSYLHNEYTPVSTDIECQLGKKYATVSLQYSLASGQ